MQNWQRFKQFMPEGMIILFEGKYFWKMPKDIEMDVGPTVIHPLSDGWRMRTQEANQDRRIRNRASMIDLVQRNQSAIESSFLSAVRPRSVRCTARL